MSYEQVMDRVRFIVYGNDAWRAYVKPGSAGTPDITFDAHGLTVMEAQKILEELIRLMYCVSVNLTVIHGYRHGTAIRDMLQTENFGDRLVYKVTPAGNPGITHMTIRRAA